MRARGVLFRTSEGSDEEGNKAYRQGANSYQASFQRTSSTPLDLRIKDHNPAASRLLNEAKARAKAFQINS